MIREPNPSAVRMLTPQEAESFMTILEAGMRLVRDDVPINEIEPLLGQRFFYDDIDHTYSYRRPDFKGIIFTVTVRKTADGEREPVLGFGVEIHTPRYLGGLDKSEIERRLDLVRGDGYQGGDILHYSPMVGFQYDSGLDAISCYPVHVMLGYFKDSEIFHLDPRADEQAKYLEDIQIMRAHSLMTHEETALRQQRIPQCRSRQLAPRSGLWKPIIPNDVPFADYWHGNPNATLARRIERGKELPAAGLGDQEDEARVLWTWVGE